MNIPKLLFVLIALPTAALLAGCDGLKVSQRTLDFGKVLVGATSPAMGVHWSNDTAQTYTIVAWDPADAPFASTHPNDPAVTPGTSTHAATITFSPTATGRADSKVRPRTAPHSSESARVRGEGVLFIQEGTGFGVEGVSAATAPLDFGRKHINSAPPKTRTFTITNQTTSPINLTATMLGGAPPFGVQNANVVVPALDATTSPPTPGRVTVTLTFAPTAVGEQRGAVVFVGPNHKVGLSLKGTGVAVEEEEGQ